MKKMSFRSIFNWLYAKTLDRAMSDRQPREDRVMNHSVYRLVSVSYLSRVSLIALLLLFLGGWNTQAWGGTWYAKINAAANPSDGGYVYVGTSSNCSASNATKSTDDGENSASKSWHSSGDVNLWLCAKANSGYTFKGWNTDKSNTVLSGSTAVPYKVTVHGTAKVLGIGGESYDYYAIFARLASTTASGGTFQFGDIVVGEESGTQTLTINHAHAGTVSLSKSGHSDDFVLSESSFTSVAEDTKNITITFKPTSNGLRTCTLTVSSDNGLSSLTYYLKGTGYNKPSITWVDGDGNELTSGETTLSAGDVLRASCTTGQTISYSDFNSSYFTSGTDGEGNPILTVREDISGTINNLSVTANLAKNTKTYYAAYSEAFTLNVTNLTPQEIEWTDDIADLSNENMPYTITLSAVAKNAKTGAASGLPVTYSMASNASLSLSGNVLTVRALGGPVAITASVAGNASYAPASVTKYATVINMTDPCATSDNHSGGTLNRDSKNFDIYPTVPKQLTFRVTKSSIAFLADLEVIQYNASGTQLEKTTIGYGDISTSGTNRSINCNANTTRIRFNAGAYLGYSYTISNVQTTRNTTSSVSLNTLSYSTDPGQSLGKQITVTYSNIPVFLSFKSDEDAGVSSGKSLWSVNTSHFGGCGKKGSQLVTVTFLSNAKGEYTDKLYVRNNVGDLLHTIDLSASVTAQEQFLKSWNIANTYNTTDQVTLQASTTVDNTDFTFTPTTSNPANIVTITNTGVMTFTGSGTATIRAYQPGDAISQEFETTHDITINKVTPNIATNPSVAEIKYKGTFANSQLSEGLATVTLRGVPDTKVDGTFTWKTLNGTTVNDAAGSHDYMITFTPTDGGMYKSSTFAQSVTVSRADGGIEMNNGEVLVKVSGINDDLNECKIDLDDLVKEKVVDAVSSRAGVVSYKVISENKAKAAIDGENKFSATQVGTYTIRATQAQTSYYKADSAEFTVTVNKLTPTIVFDNTDDPQIIYSGDSIGEPAARMYNDKVIDRKVQYESNDIAIYVGSTTDSNKYPYLKARDVVEEEGSAVNVMITASTKEDDLYYAVVETTHNYAVRAKRSPHFTMDGHTDKAVSKTLPIGETATITYNENTDNLFAIGTASELAYISYTHDAEHRTITVRAEKGAIVGNGVQTLTLSQPGTERLFPREIVYTFTVQRNTSAMTLTNTATMLVEDTIEVSYTGLANTTDAVQFSCTPEGSMKYEDGKLIALLAGTNTVTFSQPATEYWTGISQSKTITVNKRDPKVSTELNNRHAWYSIIEHPFKSLNTEKELQITSSNESLAKYIKEEDKIFVYGTSGNVTFTVNQDANYKYNAVVNYQKTFEIFQPNNRLPMTLDNSNFEDYKGGYAGNVSWNDGVLCGKPNTSVLLPTTGDYFDWSAKYIILKFVGVPDKLSFDFENASSIATQYGWHFYQSSNGSDWELIKEYQDLLMNASGGTSSGSESNLQLDPATQYIKLEYHGNYGGRFKNVHVTERKEIAPRDATKDFGLGYNGNDPTMRAITVDWYNVKPCTVTITGTDADKFVLDEGSKTINSQLDHYGTVDLLVSYKHETNSETTHTATLRIEDVDGNYADVTLNGQTTPAPQTIIWRNDLTPMPIEGSFQNAAMVSTGQAVTLESDHPEIVRVVNNTTLEPVSAGTARVTATAAGSTKWAETTDYMDIEVTTLKVQYITWTDNLSNRKRKEGQTVEIELTATSSAGLPITYELDEDAQTFASINGNVLSLTDWGSGQVIAKQVGNEEYVAVQASKSLVSRNPNAKCRPLVGEYKDAYTLHTLAVKDIPIYGEPDSVTFWAKCDWDALWGMWVAEEYNGAFHDIQEISRTGKPNITSDYQYYSFPLHRNATAVRLYTKTGATMTRTFKNVEIPLAKYLELAENTMNFSQVDKGSTKTQSFYINYSNLSGVLDVEMENKENTQFTVVTTTVGEDCGDAAKNVRIDISCTGSTLGTENNTIIVHNADQSLRIPVSATVVLPSQTITWEPELDVLTTDEVVLSATATSELPVSFTSGNTDIADVVCEGGVYSLDIKKYGDVEITAHQTGNENWSAATDKTLTYHISRVTPNILSYPTATGVVLPNTLAGSTLEGGSVDGGIAGTFRWQDATISVTKGVATYTAVFDPEDDDYYETVAFEVEVEILKTPQTITWSRAAESEEWCADVIALDATATSGLAVVYHSSDSTIAYAEGDHLKVLKYGVVTITATQAGDDTYAPAENVSKQITLKRNQLTLDNLSATYMYVHHFLSNSTPTGQAYTGGQEVYGSFTWLEPEKLMDNPGMNTCEAVFIPYNKNIYEPKACAFSVEVRRFAPAIDHNFTTEPADYGVKVSELVLNGSGKAIDYIDPAKPEIAGVFEWKNPTHIPYCRETSAILVFRPERTEWYDEVEIPVDITINTTGYIFTGDGDWNTGSNWAEGVAPSNAEDVIIQGHVTITSDVEVHNMTIEGGGSVTMTLNGTLTVNGKSAELEEYGDVHVQETGSLILGNNAKLKVRDFILDAKLGINTNDASTSANSGQVLQENQLEVNGDAYFQLALDPSGRNTYGWYDFTVPFEVDVIGGISIAEDPSAVMKFNVNYAVMDYTESKRAVKGKDWNKFQGTMKPGKVYTIALDDDYDWNTVVFKKKASAALTGDRTLVTEYSGLGAEAKDNGWNGFGNGTLHHTELNVDGETQIIQVYDHANMCYQPREAKDFTIVVGMTFFTQLAQDETVELVQAVGNTKFLAPSREGRNVDNFRLSLTADGNTYASDYLWVSADEEATGDYIIGRDVLKMGTMNESNVARIWSVRNGMNLCSNNLTLTDNNAICDLKLYAPKAMTYSLAIEKAPEDANLYLTYNGNVIWDLTASPYSLDLTKGTTEGYGLQMEVVNAPQVTTGMDEINGEKDGNRKVLIGNEIYIITKEGAIFNATGKKVK